MNLLIRKIYSLAQIVIPFPIKIFLRRSVWKFLYFKLILRNFLCGEFPYKKVYCPISDTHFNEFIPIYKEYDPNLPSHAQPRISPDSGARESLRLQWLFLKHETNLMKEKINLLHFGPEYCYYRIFKEMNNINYCPVDKNNKKYSKDIKYIDLAELNIETNTFEMIICNHVLEHVEDDKKAVMEMYRVLKPGGVAIITVPIDFKRDETYEDLSVTKPKDREREFGQWDHVRYYGLDFQQRLETAGFTVKTEHYARSFSIGDYEKYGLADEPIFVCKKR